MIYVYPVHVGSTPRPPQRVHQTSSRTTGMPKNYAQLVLLVLVLVLLLAMARVYL